MSQRTKVKFPKIHHLVSASLHCEKRMKQRANLKTRQKRNAFVRKAAEECFCPSDVPTDDIRFASFLGYLNHIRRRVHDLNPSCKVYIFREFFLIISDEGVMVTIYKISDDYKNIYEDLKAYYKNQGKEEAID
mgnify:CR=1 FL=1